jgi:hypothetical protein
VCLKNICDGVGGQDESNGIPLYPPLFWLDNIFKQIAFFRIKSLAEQKVTKWQQLNVGRGWGLDKD